MTDDLRTRHFWEDDDMAGDQPIIDPQPLPRFEVITDRAATIEAIAELDASLQMAEYDLRAAVALARVHGLQWKEVAEAIGTSPQNCQQRFSGKRSLDVLSLDAEERARIGRLIGLRGRVARYVVRRWVDGRKGITKMVYEDLSRHLRPEVARRRAEQAAELYGADRIDVLRELPDGTRRPVSL